MSFHGNLIPIGKVLCDGVLLDCPPNVPSSRIEVATSDLEMKRRVDAQGYVVKVQRPNSFEMVLDLPLGLRTF